MKSLKRDAQLLTQRQYSSPIFAAVNGSVRYFAHSSKEARTDADGSEWHGFTGVIISSY